jgi:thymidylate synthase
MTTKVCYARNVNDALRKLTEEDILNENEWRTISPRGMETREHRGTYITEYSHPRERVLFNQDRDANPFFHFFESLWILDGRSDATYLEQFNSNIAKYLDPGKLSFHAAYGNRMRQHFVNRDEEPCDQLKGIIELLKKDPDTRRAVMCLWSPIDDLGWISYNGDFEHAISNDLPCNDLIMFKLRDNELDITVSCRSNDAIWGAYGANAVQFSMIQEFVALAVGCNVGVYRQVSDSFHIYTDNEAWKRVKNSEQRESDFYRTRLLQPYPLMQINYYESWLRQNHHFLIGNLFDGTLNNDIITIDPFFTKVADPILQAHNYYKGKNLTVPHAKNRRIDMALTALYYCAAPDWKLACEQWLERRREHESDKNAVEGT